MSDDPMADQRTTDPLRTLGKQLPYDRPDAVRRDAVRSSLLIAASEGQRPGVRSRWLLIGTGFTAGAFAAAAVAIIAVRWSEPPQAGTVAHTRIGESTDAKTLYDRHAPTPTGSMEIVKRVSAGTFSFEVPAGRNSKHVRLQTGDAEVDGSGSYEVVVLEDRLASVTVATGTATVRVNGQQQAVFLAAGETWRPSVITADLDIAPATLDVVDTARVAPTSAPPAIGTPDIAAPNADATNTANPAIQAATTARPPIAPPSTVTSSTTPATSTSTTPPKAARTPQPRTVGAPVKPEVTATESLPAPAAPRASITAASITAASEPPPSASEPPPSASEPPPVAVIGHSRTEKSFRAGYSMLRANNYEAAAAELGKAAEGDQPLAADARYFQAIALTKAGRGADAERALVAFLDRAPTSVRRGRAAVMLGRRLASRGDSKSARAWFESALGDADPAVATAARAGLDSLE